MFRTKLNLQSYAKQLSFCLPDEYMIQFLLTWTFWSYYRKMMNKVTYRFIKSPKDNTMVFGVVGYGAGVFDFIE